jgi:radical SAM/Cys-rich protein
VLLMRAAALKLPVLADDGVEFERALRESGLGPLVRARATTLQINVGRLCNMACHHCHVEAGPRRTEIMARPVAERIVELLDANPQIGLVDLTGGAPEMNPGFRWLVAESRRRGRRVIDRCNLTILFEPGMEGLAEFLAVQEVEVVASLPCYQASNVDRQRGRGAFDKSIEALRWLSSLDYGARLQLDLVYNPVGAFLPPPQAQLESKYREELRRLFGIEFHRLLTITNMPIKRFADSLARTRQAEAYQALLVNHFNPATVPELMCRSLVSVGYDGRLFDCDFNQMLELPLGAARARTIWEIDSLDELTGQKIATARHCFGCTAGSGSSCAGALR